MLPSDVPADAATFARCVIGSVTNISNEGKQEN